MRKRIANPETHATTEAKGDWLDLEKLAEVEVTSENADAPNRSATEVGRDGK